MMRLAFLVCGLVMPVAGQCLALLNSSQALPNGLSNNVVSILIDDDTRVKPKPGSGFVVRLHKDSSGTGGWAVILTADHVTFNADRADVIFSNGYDTDYLGGKSMSVVGAPTVDGKLVDLSLLKVRIPDVGKLPKFGQFEINPVKNDATVVLAGEGWKYKSLFMNQGVPAAYVVQEDFGHLRSGTDRLIKVDKTYGWTYEHVKGNRVYSFKSILGRLDYDATKGIGDAYPADFDSGGPTFHETCLVGIHSASSVGKVVDGNEILVFGSKWGDVQVATYKQWIVDNWASPNPLPEAVPDAWTEVFG